MLPTQVPSSLGSSARGLPQLGRQLRVCHAPQQPSRQPSTALRASASVSSGTEHTRYLEEVALAPAPANVTALLRVLQVQGLQAVSPAERAGLHPLLVPLAVGPAPAPTADGPTASIRGDTAVTGLLRWPDLSRSQTMPVVRMSAGAPSMTLLARSVDEYLHRALAEEDYSTGRGGPGRGPLAQAAGAQGEALYRAGGVAAAGARSLPVYLAQCVGRFPDVAEALAAGHLARHDTMSALVAAEWYMRGNHFPNWARPFEFNAHLLQRIQRHEEARDLARVALRLPWWSLGAGFAAARQLAGLAGDAAHVRASLSEEAAARGAQPANGAVQQKSAQEVAAGEARFLLNKAAAGEAQWDSIRPELAGLYEQAGLSDVARFMQSD